MIDVEFYGRLLKFVKLVREVTEDSLVAFEDASESSATRNQRLQTRLAELRGKSAPGSGDNPTEDFSKFEAAYAQAYDIPAPASAVNLARHRELVDSAYALEEVLARMTDPQVVAPCGISPLDSDSN